jgi:hypothetical protein
LAAALGYVPTQEVKDVLLKRGRPSGFTGDQAQFDALVAKCEEVQLYAILLEKATTITPVLKQVRGAFLSNEWNVAGAPRGLLFEELDLWLRELVDIWPESPAGTVEAGDAGTASGAGRVGVVRAAREWLSMFHPETVGADLEVRVRVSGRFGARRFTIEVEGTPDGRPESSWVARLELWEDKHRYRETTYTWQGEIPEEEVYRLSGVDPDDHHSTVVEALLAAGPAAVSVTIVQDSGMTPWRIVECLDSDGFPWATYKQFARSSMRHDLELRRSDGADDAAAATGPAGRPR